MATTQDGRHIQQIITAIFLKRFNTTNNSCINVISSTPYLQHFILWNVEDIIKKLLFQCF